MDHGDFGGKICAGSQTASAAGAMVLSESFSNLLVPVDQRASLAGSGTSLVAQMVKRLDYNVGILGSVPGSGRYSGEGNGNPFQYSCLENPMDGVAWYPTVHGVAKSHDFTFTFSVARPI